MDMNCTVCNMSKEVQLMLKQLKNKCRAIEHRELLSDISEVAAKVRVIRKRAQHMENRLKKYRDAIEDLGFERKLH